MFQFIFNFWFVINLQVGIEMAPRVRNEDDPGIRDIHLANVPNRGLGKLCCMLMIIFCWLFLDVDVYYCYFFPIFNFQ